MRQQRQGTHDNLVVQDCVSFCAACSVGRRDKKLRLDPKSNHIGLQDLSVGMVFGVQPRDEASSVFTAWRQLLLQSSHACWGFVECAEDATCLEVDVKSVSFCT